MVQSQLEPVRNEVRISLTQQCLEVGVFAAGCNHPHSVGRGLRKAGVRQCFDTVHQHMTLLRVHPRGVARADPKMPRIEIEDAVQLAPRANQPWRSRKILNS